MARFFRGITLANYPATSRYLVGVSGGRDSMALLHLLIEEGYTRLIVCHLDHGLRDAAKDDAKFVERVADALGLPAEIGHADVRALAKGGKQSVETAAREARYRFFAEVAKRRRCRTLFLAHQADDQVETFLFNLFRGSGPAGLAGMAAESERAIGRGRLRVVRPLLAVWREEIDAYLKEHAIPFRDDASNTDPAHARNRIRAQIIPEIAKAFGREIKPAIWRAADLLSAEEAWLGESLSQEIAALPARLPLAKLKGEPLARQRRLVRAWLQARGARGIGYEEVEVVLSLLDVEHGPAKVNLPGNRHARRRGGVLFLGGQTE